MKFLLVLCALVAFAFANYGVSNDNYHVVGYGHHDNYIDSPFYKEPHHKHRRGRHGRHGRHGRRHRGDRSSYSSSGSSSESRSYESRSYERDYYPYPHHVPSYGNVAYEAPAATAYGSPSNDVPAPAPYGVNSFGKK
ncbi:hypothetical protein B9Z55_023870 [Caenorhabditis nigoni]|uniref:Uncharacterized protein n=1 Tax=Caenorhabditis nigoni TaxID=1611254 RepID=A0A2G5SS03_9PELO|nr:hypothetical protein B9Z55_023870 [Caenorhabditis nigoni]